MGAIKFFLFQEMVIRNAAQQNAKPIILTVETLTYDLAQDFNGTQQKHHGPSLPFKRSPMYILKIDRVQSW